MGLGSSLHYLFLLVFAGDGLELMESGIIFFYFMFPYMINLTIHNERSISCHCHCSENNTQIISFLFYASLTLMVLLTQREYVDNWYYIRSSDTQLVAKNSLPFS